MPSVSDRAKLIEYLYRVAVEPEQFDQLMTHWGKVLDDIDALDGKQLSGKDGVKELDEELTRHIKQANNVLKEIGRSTKPHLSLETPIMLDPNPAMILDRSGKIIIANETASKEFEVHRGDPISNLPIKDERMQGIFARLSLGKEKNPADNGMIGLVQVKSSTSNRRIMLVLSYVETPLTPDAHILVTTPAPMWNPEIEAMLQNFFGLSGVESHVVQSLVHGLGIKEIAAQRNRSVDTVRNQLKRVLQKTGSNSQVELVNLIGGLKTFTPEPEPSFSTGGGLDAEFFSQGLPDGRQLEYFVAGDPNGTPILFIHGMMDGYQLTPAIKQAAAKYSLKIIAPARPGYGGSSIDDAPGEPEDKFAEDVMVLMDQLKLKKCPFIGHMGGSAYVFAFADKFPGHISQIFNIAGSAPFTNEKQLAQISPNHSRMAMTYKHLPNLFPMFLRAGVAVLERRGEEAFLRVLYGKSPIDFDVARIPANTQVLNEGFRVSAMHGHKAFMIDIKVLTSDWSRYCENIRCPITLVHGVHDHVVPIARIREFSDSLQGAELIEYQDSGQLVLYQRPDEVLALIVGKMRSLRDKL